MKTINRRTLNHNLAQVLDSVLETGEEVRVEGRDGKAILITPAPEETTWERWQRTGALIPPRNTSGETFTEIAARRTNHLPVEEFDKIVAELEDTY